MKEIFVGNVAFDVSESDLKDFFENYGEIEQCKLITDRVTGKSRGFGFVKYTSASSAENAVKEAHGQSFKGRPLNVKLSEPREKSTGGSTGGFAGRGGRPGPGGNGGRPQNRSFGERSDRGDRGGRDRG
jgi:RNA recognition motif-containing protein